MEEFVSVQTGDIVVSACPSLIEEAMGQNLWGYYLCIENNSSSKIQIVGKDWNITDDKGNSFHDDSAGFKGEIPELEPGETFEFTSEAPLESSNAVFYGNVKILYEGQGLFEEVKIPSFPLSTGKNFAMAS